MSSDLIDFKISCNEFLRVMCLSELSLEYLNLYLKGEFDSSDTEATKTGIGKFICTLPIFVSYFWNFNEKSSVLTINTVLSLKLS